MNTFSKIIIVLIFVLAGLLFVHNITSINADIGRHIKLGEIIWQTKDVPKTNLFSYTAPDFPFINHHWLSEVIFYGIFNIGGDWLSGLRAIIVLKALVLLATYFVLYLIVSRRRFPCEAGNFCRKHNIVAVTLSFLVSIFVFSARTEPRPEIFSYLIFAIYLFSIYRAKEGEQKWLWFLPIFQIFWVNLHIYFAIGPIVYFLFLVDRAVARKLSKKLLLIGVLMVGANFVNPNFIDGALYPLKVLNNYGYSVAENSSLFFLAKYFGHWSPQDKLFLISVFIAGGSFVLRRRLFDVMLLAVMAVLSFKMQRNIPLFALSLWPVLSDNLSGLAMSKFLQRPIGNPPLTGPMEPLRDRHRKSLLIACYILLTTILAGSIYLVTSGRFYNYLDSSKTFGLRVSSAAQDGADFIKQNQIQGPMFNNFDIGSYLIWQLYPEHKVFIDGRPEAYPVDFFEKVYKPMQRDEKIWIQASEQYGINYVFFVHTDMTEWADEFLIRISKDKEWPMVFLNDAIVIFLKNAEINKHIISEHKTNEQNIDNKISRIVEKLNKKDDNAFINFGNALYRFRFLTASAKVYETLIANQPHNPYGYQGAAYAYATMNDPATQEKAAQNFEMAIDLGFKTFHNYFTLGIINANLGNLFEAEQNIKKALEIDPDNQNAKQVLRAIKREQGL